MLKVVNLNYERNDQFLFADCNFHLTPGNILHITGPNGIGKTTLLRMLCGLLPATQGEIIWREQSITRIKEQYLSQLIYVGHQSGVKGNLTPAEDLQTHAILSGHHLSQHSKELLQHFDLNDLEDSFCYALSAGQQRRVALTRLVANHLPLWILDEPFTALDNKGIAVLNHLLEYHAQQNGMTILTSHQPLHQQVPITELSLTA